MAEALIGKVAVVTGAARGIGAAIARGLAEAGADVALWDVDGAAAAATATQLAAETNRRTVGRAVDVTKLDAVTAAVQQTEAALGPIAVLVNNAGIDVISPFMTSDPEDWDRIIAVNLKGVFHCCRAVLDGMIARGAGSIVNLGSDAGRVGSSGEAVYSATKGGVIAFTKTLAREMARQGITVNCVCPGPTETALLGQVAAYSPRLYEGMAKAIPLRRTAQPDDIAPAVVFLASPAARYITGQTVSVSGGLTMV